MKTNVSPLAFFIQDLGGGGAEKIVVQLVNAFAENGSKVDLIRQDVTGVYVKDLSPQVNSIVIGSRSPFRTIVFLYKYLKHTNPQVLFTSLEKSSLLGIIAAWCARYRKVVPSVHIDLNAYVTLDHQLRRRLLRAIVAVFYRYSARVVVVSKGTGDALRRVLGPRVPIDVIFNGFDIENLRKQSREGVTLPFATDKAVPVFISCGRLTRQKGFDILLHAFALIRQEMPARLIILGHGPLKETLVLLGQELNISDDLYFPGFVSSPAAWFGRSDVFVLSSRAEGFGNVLVEALAAGIRIVSTDCPSGPAEILQSGQYGQLVPVDDVKALAAAMKSALIHGQGYELLNASAQAYIQEYFSIKSMTDGYARVAASFAART
jgi:glycosyltransferase involved in cell wall biosynthesis